MNIPPVSEPTHDAMLAELASLGMRAGRVVVRLIEVEQAAVDVIAAWLPAPGGDTTALADALAEGQAVDAVQAATLVAVPRVEVLARALDRISRSVRRSIALRRRLEAGWLGAGSVDDRAAMVRRQVARSVGEAIRREIDGEAAERLFDELAERMEEPEVAAESLTLPVEELVRRVCRDLGLAVDALGEEMPPPGVKRTTVLLRGSGQGPGGVVDSG